MKRGAPVKPRSRLLAGIGGYMTREQARAVQSILADAYGAELPDDMPACLADAFASYKADAAALAAAVGAGEESKDAATIARDCRDLAAELPADGDAWPRLSALCARLRDRLEQFPPTVDDALHAAGIDVWPQLERLRAGVMRPRLLSTIRADLLTLADACDRCPPPPRHTKRPMIARDRFRAAILAALNRWPLPVDNATERGALVLALFEALDVMRRNG